MAISAKQFEELQKRISGPRKAVPIQAPARRFDTVIGIDPSLRGTGYGIIRVAKPTPIFVAQGTIACPQGWQRSRCLAHITRTLRDVLKAHQPQVCVVEGLFYAQNFQTALIMGEARGASLAIEGASPVKDAEAGRGRGRGGDRSIAFPVEHRVRSGSGGAGSLVR